ncbi:MAG: sulfatase-like hydrolase/transferase [Betaproteobacteria bacterium]|nr:sulfatase-like hydrolase/transferase [Betaproteobacteria bacterium]
MMTSSEVRPCESSKAGWKRRAILLAFGFVLLGAAGLLSPAAQAGAMGYCPQLSQALLRGMRDTMTSPQGQVSELQRFFLDHYGIGQQPAVTGEFDAATEALVLRFQEEQGIELVGAVGPRTRIAIARACASGDLGATEGTAGGGSGGGVAPGAGNGATRPSIVVIMTDDQDDMGSMSVMTKTKQLLADQGVTFVNSFVEFPLCCVSRASFLTGQYAHNHGVMGNTPDEDGGYARFMATEDNTIPVWLENAGYATALIGKYLNGYGDGKVVPAAHVPPGWSEWQGLPEEFGTYNYFSFGVNRNGVLERFGPVDYQTDVLAQRAADYIGSVPIDKPLFLWLAPIAPHFGGDGDDAWGGPFPAPRHEGALSTLALPQPPSFNEADVSDKPAFMRQLPLMSEGAIATLAQSFRNRRETLLAVDDMVETVVRALQDSGRLENTFVVFTSDNGFSQGEHRRPEGKRVVYEESIRVPLVIRGPGVPKGAVRTQLVNNVDLPATIVDAAGISAGRTFDGRSLLPLVSDEAAPWRSALLIEGTDSPLPRVDWESRYEAVRTTDYLFADHLATGESELYDLRNDPHQIRNGSDEPSYATVTIALRNALGNLRSCAGASCWFAGSLVAPTCTMTADRNIVTAGETAQIAWSSTHALTVLDQDGRSSTASGSVAVAPTQTTSYSYRFTNSVGSTTCRQTISVKASGLTGSGLSVENRNVLAKALGYTGEFGDGAYMAWLSEGYRASVWDTLTARLLANAGDSEQEIYALFPSLDPNHPLACGTKSKRDRIAHELGFAGMFGVIDAQGVRVTDGEFPAWRDADPARRSVFDAACARPGKLTTP